MIRLASNLTLPVEAATQTFLVVGKRGSGKSTTCVRLAEQLVKAHVPIVALDPVDRWWGLKAARDGKGPGLSVYVFGGEHADLPLEPNAGVVIADTLIEHRISAVLSVKHLSGRERGQFVADLAGRLFQRNKDPLHVFLEEAHEVAPQQPFKGEEEMLGRVTRLWKLGRSSGLGGAAITQRPASLSKNITTQAEILVVHRTLGPQDVAAVREWIRYHGERDDILGELATLKTGECFVWAPDFPEGKPIGLRRVQILDRETFDSSATPKVGERAVEPKALAPVDLERLRTRMAATIAKAKADDPRELRRRIAELEQQRGALQHTLDLWNKECGGRSPREIIAQLTAAAPKRVEVPILKDAQIKRLEQLTVKIEAVLTKMVHVRGSLDALLEHEGAMAMRHAVMAIRDAIRAKVAPLAPLYHLSDPVGGHAGAAAPRRPSPAISRSAAPVDGLGKGEHAVLIAIAQHGDGGVTRQQVTVLTGYKRRTRDTYLQRLTAAGLAAIAPTGQVLATDAGVAALGPSFAPLPTGEALRAHWLTTLPEGERRILTVLVEAYPTAFEREALSGKTGYKRRTRDTYLQRLHARQLIVIEHGGAVRASDTLF
jgi:uncharacterized protein